MNEELMAIDKKIQSTEEELTRLKQQLNPNSTEYVFSSAVLVKRLLELKEQKRELELKNERNSIELDEEDKLSEVIEEVSFDRHAPEVASRSEERTRLDPIEMASNQKLEDKKETINLILSGKGVGTGSISIRTLSTILHHFQTMTDQIANSVLHGPSMSDHIPAHILRQSDLTIKHTYPGSFGIELEASTPADESMEGALLHQSLTKLFELFRAGTKPQQLMDQIAYLGPQALAHYRQWMGFMADQGMQLECEWKPSNGQKTAWSVDKESLPSIVKALESIRVDRTREMELIGSFIGMNVRDNTFEILDLDSNDLISGKSQRDVLMQNRLLIGEKAKLKMIKCVAENESTGEEKILWYLRYISPLLS